MAFTYENQGTNSFLVYSVAPSDALDTMGIGMISNNKIPHILSISCMQEDNQAFLKYNISSRVSLTNYFDGVVSRKRILNVFSDICEAIEFGYEYMLESNLFILDTDYIYVNVSTGETSLVYLPVLGRQTANLGRFFKEIVFSTQFDSGEDCSYVAKIINYLNSSENFSLQDFKKLLILLRSTSATVPAAEIKVQRTDAPEISQSRPSAPQATVAAPKPIKPQEPASPQPMATPPRPVPIQPDSIQAARPAPVQTARPMTVAEDTLPKPDKEEKSGFGFFSRHKEKVEETPAREKVGQYTFAVPGMEESEKIPRTETKGKTGSIFGFGKKPQQPANKPKVQQPIQPPPRQAAPLSTLGKQEAAVENTDNTRGFVPAQNRTPEWKAIKSQAPYGETSILNSGRNGQTTVLSQQPAGQTTVLGGTMEQKSVPYLYRKKNGKKILLDKILFRVGTERSFVDYCVTDNSAVSHSHADFINHAGTYYLRDNNSTNHTYLNGKMIPSNQEYPLENGDKVVLANEEFEFYSK